MKCCHCQASYIGETGRNLSTRRTEHKRATRNGDVNNHIADHHLPTKHQIDWDSATCITYSTDYYQLLNGLWYFAQRNETKRNGTLRNGNLRNGTLRNGYTSANAPKFFALATKS